MSSDKFIKEQSADQFVFTKFKGTDVLGPDNARVGSVDDLLFDKNGKIVGIVVGGFLGIGAKNVAIGMSAFDVVPADIGGDRSNAQPTSGPGISSWKRQSSSTSKRQYVQPRPRRPLRPAQHLAPWPRPRPGRVGCTTISGRDRFIRSRLLFQVDAASFGGVFLTLLEMRAALPREKQREPGATLYRRWRVASYPHRIQSSAPRHQFRAPTVRNP